MKIVSSAITFENVFDLMSGDLTLLEIRENNQHDNCFIRDRATQNKFYNTFILHENSQTKVICEIAFYKSSETSKYLPRLTFKKTNKIGDVKIADEKKPVIIAFSKSEEALAFWKLIGFLKSFKDVVELGDFDTSFQVHSKDTYFIEFQDKGEKEKIEDLKELILKSNLSELDIKSIVFENRKRTIKAFLWLLKNIEHEGTGAMELYRRKYGLQPGEESVWHHFLKNNDWILGLNVDIKFVLEFYDEQKVGTENSLGKGSPKTDMLGVSDYTTLIELKHSNTTIFKKEKSKARSNTWDFTSDFIEGISQCLGQKFSFEKSYTQKEFIDKDGKRLDKSIHLTTDPKCVFVIGNRKKEFPHDLLDEHHVKSETFEIFRRNNRNIDIITYDELFERAYHIVYSDKVQKDWHDNPNFMI